MSLLKLRLHHRFGCALIGSVLLGMTACSNGDPMAEIPMEERIDFGVESLRVFDFESAYKALTPLQAELSPEDENWALATYSLALATWHKAPPSREAVLRAEELLIEVAEKSSDEQIRASALLDLGRIAEISDYLGEPTDVPKAQAYYRQVLEEFAGTEMATRAAIFLAQSYAQSFDPENVETAIAILKEALVETPDTPWAGTIYQYMANLYAFYLDDYSDALDPYEKAMEVGFPRSSEGDMSLWQLGLMAEEAGDDFLAVEAYTRIIEEYPRSIFGSVGRNRIIAISEENPDADIEVPDLAEVQIGR